MAKRRQKPIASSKRRKARLKPALPPAAAKEQPQSPRWLATGELAGHFGIATRTVHGWISKGCPCHRHGVGKPVEFDLPAVASWLKERQLTTRPGRPKRPVSEQMERARLRKERASARRVELLVRQLEGRLLDADQVVRDWTLRVRLVRDRLMALPTKMSPRLAGRDAQAVRGMLQREVEGICNEFAAGTSAAVPGAPAAELAPRETVAAPEESPAAPPEAEAEGQNPAGDAPRGHWRRSWR